MLCVLSSSDDTYDIYDTDHNTVSFLTQSQISDMISSGVRINGVSGHKIISVIDKAKAVANLTGKSFGGILVSYGFPDFMFKYLDFPLNGGGSIVFDKVLFFGIAQEGDLTEALRCSVLVNDMSALFGRFHSQLDKVDFSLLNTCRVKRMDGVFQNNDAVKTLDLSGFDTSRVWNMFRMFYNCHDLVSLDLRSFDTRRVKTMEEMFRRCSSLESLDISSFSADKLEYSEDMFRGCNSLKNLVVSDERIREQALRDGIKEEAIHMVSK